MFVYFWDEVRSSYQFWSLLFPKGFINFISIRAWVDNLYIKNCIENLTVVMLSYFYKDNKYKI